MIKIIDDFLDPKEFEEIKTFMENNEFPWYFNRGKVRLDDGRFQYIHTFFHGVNQTNKITRSSDFLNMWDPRVCRIGVPNRNCDTPTRHTRRFGCSNPPDFSVYGGVFLPKYRGRGVQHRRATS